MTGLRFHPLCEAFPLIEGKEFDELVADIKAHGLKEDILTFGGMILDGRNRLRACQQANEKPRFKVFVGTEAQARALVVSANVHRRHLTGSQRAFAFAELAKWAERGGQNKSAPGADSNVNKNKVLENTTIREAAEEAHVSDRTMHQAKAVAEKGSKKLKESVRSGDVSVKKAAAVVDLPKSEQLAAARAKPEKVTPENTEEPTEPEVSAEEEAEALEAAERELAASLDKILKADDRLAAAHAELKRQSAEISSLKRARDQFMHEKGEAVKLLRSEQRKCATLQKKLKSAEEANEKLRERIAIMKER